MPPAPPEVPVRAATERWFLHRGLPHFIDGYRADRDVLTRALPALLILLLLQLTLAADISWTWWQNLLAAALTLAALVIVWMVINVLRGRPRLSRPRRVGPIEVGLFLLLPAVVVLVAHGSPGEAAVELVVSAALLGVVYLVVSYGLVPMTRWAFGQMIGQLGSVISLAGRALPLLLLIAITLFVASDFWQVAAALAPGRLTAVLAFLAVIVLIFLLARLPHEVARVSDGLDDPTIRTAVVGTPVADALGPAAVVSPPLSRRQRGNVLLVLLFSQAVQVVLVGLLTAGFFLVFGVVAIKPEVIELWLSGSKISHPYLHPGLFGVTITVSQALLRVCALLGGIAAFYFAIYVITDATYRAEFFDDILSQVRQSIAVRAVYLKTVSPMQPAGEDAR